MNRRTALGILAAGAGVLALPALPGCDASPKIALAPWSGPPPAVTDVRLRALAYASLAPNAHNTQPWLVSLGKDWIDLFVDGSRLLPETDPPYRQTHVSQGTFLELLVIALAEAGVASDVTYFPEGEYGNDALEPLPVARVRWTGAAAKKDPLFCAILRRRSNKSVYEPNHGLTRSEIRALTGAPSPETGALHVIDDPGARVRLAGILTDAMAVEVRAAPRNAETAKWFRFSERETEEKRDGFGMAQTGRGALARFFAEKFLLSRRSAADPNGAFARGAIETTRDQAGSAAAFGVLESASNTRRAQVLAGRAYARAALTATSLGLAMHPMSQSLEEYPAMAATKARMEREVGLPAGSTVQMLFRLGHAADTEHTPRRNARDLIKPA